MNRESILIALYESYTQLGTLLSELTTLRQGNPNLKPTTKEVDMAVAGSSNPVVSNRDKPKTQKVTVTEDPKRRFFDWKDARTRLEARRKGRGQDATGQPKKPGMIGRLMSKVRRKLRRK